MILSLVIQFLAALCVGILAARDEIWQSCGSPTRIMVVQLWCLSPVGLIAGRSITESQLTIDPWYFYVAVLALVLGLTRGRPALMMDQLWPDDVRADEAIVARGQKASLGFVAVVLLCGMVAVGAYAW